MDKLVVYLYVLMYYPRRLLASFGVFWCILVSFGVFWVFVQTSNLGASTVLQRAGAVLWTAGAAGAVFSHTRADSIKSRKYNLMVMRSSPAANILEYSY